MPPTLTKSGRRNISQLGERENIDQVFLVADKQLRPNRNGNLYLSLRLSDRTGSMSGMLWNANDDVYRSFENGDFVRVEGTTQYYNGAMQVLMNHVEKAEPGRFDEADFFHLRPDDIEKLVGRLGEMLRSIENYHLRNLAECYLMDEEFMDLFSRAPAGIKNHHAYRGGLLEHTVAVMELARLVAPLYEEIDDAVLLLGAFLHDTGKILELEFERDMSYSDEGQMIGHVVQGTQMLVNKIKEAEKLSGEDFPVELSLRLKHMVISHHGPAEYGSPKVPMTCEALALHLIDNIDSKVHSFSKLMQEDQNVDSPWTVFIPNLGRKLYKGSGGG